MSYEWPPEEVTLLYTKLLEFKQDILALENKLQSYDNYFKNILNNIESLQEDHQVFKSDILKAVQDYSNEVKNLQSRLDAHGKDINRLESTTAHKKDFSIWDFLKRQ